MQGAPCLVRPVLHPNFSRYVQYVDEVVLGAPEKLTEDFIKSNNISVVVHGKDKGK